MFKKSKKDKLDFNIVHDIATSFAAARMSSHEYDNITNNDELREIQYSNFLLDYAYVIGQYHKALGLPPIDSHTPDKDPLTISITLIDSIFKLNASLD